MRYLSLCSGIEAASAAWQPLGWEPVAFAEIEPFPCAVLAHHFPTVPNLGDITKIDGTKYRGAVDLIVAGTPCQDFSIAGKRAGMDGERSGLAREFIRLVREINPQWILWENVPGVFSTNGGRDFGAFVKSLDDSGYCCAWRVLDAQFFGVPQRRRRVFIVGYFGDWRPAAKVLFECESLRRNIKTCRKERQGITGTIKGGSGRRGWQIGAEEAASGQLQISHWDGGPHPSLNQCAKSSGGIGMSNQELFSQKGARLVASSAMAIRTAQSSSNGHGLANEVSHTLDGANGQAVCFAQNQIGELRTSNLCGTLNQNGNATGRNAPLLMATEKPDYVPDIVTQAISCKWAKGSSGPAGDEHHNLVVQSSCAAPTTKPYADNQANESRLIVQPNKTASTLCANGAGTNRTSGRANELGYLICASTPIMRVRRLTPLECERLQGFSDNWTDVEFRGKPAADSQRYKAIGNSMAVPVMRWLGERIMTMALQEGNL